MLVLCIAIKLKKSKDHYDSDLRPLVLGTSMLVLPFIPASNLLFPVGFVIAERVLYLPSAGFIVLLCLAWIKVGVKLPKWKKSLNRMMALLIIFYFIRTMMRNMDWISRKSLFLSGLQTNPANPKIRYNWANYLRDSNRSVDAATEYEEVLQLYPGYVAAMNNLATILEETPTTARKAEELYVRVIQMRPWHENAYNNLANLLVKRGKYDDAVNVLVRGVRSSTNYMTHAQNLARVLVSRGKVDKAEQIYKHIVDHFCFKKSKRNCNAQVTGLLQDYGSLLANKGDRRESLKMYKLSFQSNSSNLESMAKFANALAEAGRVEQATQLITYAVGKNKEHVVDMWKIAATFWKMNKLKESKRLYEVSVKLHPENLELIGQYAAVLFETGEHAPAVKLLKNLTARDSECQSEGVWRNFASILGRLGKHDEAIKLLLRCLEGLESVTNNSVSEINVRKGKIKCQLGKHKRDLSILFSRRNKIEEANTLWNQSLQDLEEGSSLNPGDKDCPITLKQMTNQNTST
nr:transmembrane and TPR repeat-containing protein 1-like [Ciona intestinalis]|eukprot:XP_009857538.1 transmembrane and TPR repeat-containing protein 1-like [Ciona intestinalis]